MLQILQNVEHMINSFSGPTAFLSNFYPVDIPIEGAALYLPHNLKYWPSVEHAYQAAKTCPDNWYKFDGLTAGQAKRMGKTVELRSDWEAIKRGVMFNLLTTKFDTIDNYELAIKLEQTGDHQLIEGNTWGDTYWGVCRGKGQNILGKLLMIIRANNRDLGLS